MTPALSLIGRIDEKEPTLLVALFAAIAGFLVQAGPGGVDSLQALGTATGISGLQGLLTRQRVYAPATKRAQEEQPVTRGPRVRPANGINDAEPALFVAALTFVGGFLAQVAGDVSHLQALASAGGISAVQGAATRERVYSPKTVTGLRATATVRELAATLRS